MSKASGSPARFAVGIVLGLVVGGIVVGISYGQFAGGKSSTVTSTATVVDSVVSTASGAQPSVVTSTVTRVSTAAESAGPHLTLAPTLLLYYPGDDVVLIGTIYPPPSGDQGIEVSTSNPLGTVVQVGTAETGVDNSTFFYILNTDTSSSWVSGKYTVTATSALTSTTTVFYYAASQFGVQQLELQVVAPPVSSANQEIDVAILSTVSGGALDNVTSWSTLAVYFPDGSIHRLCTSPGQPAGCTGTFSEIHSGLYQVAFTLPPGSPGGTYYFEVEGSDSSGNSAQGLAELNVP